MKCNKLIRTDPTGSQETLTEIHGVAARVAAFKATDGNFRKLMDAVEKLLTSIGDR